MHKCLALDVGDVIVLECHVSHGYLISTNGIAVYVVIGLFCAGAAESLYHCLSPFVALIPLMRTWR